MILLLALLLSSASVANEPEPTADPAQEPTPERIETDAISFVDVMPAIDRMRRGLELESMSATALEREARIRLSLFSPSSIETPVDSVEQLVNLFLMIAILRELHRRDLLGRDLSPVEVQVSFHLHQIGVRAQNDPIFDRRLKRWLNEAQGTERGALLRDIRISLQAASEVAGRWFPETVMAAQRRGQQEEKLSILIGMFLVEVGELERGIAMLESVYSFGQMPIRVEAYYRALRLGGRHDKADSLKRDMREPAPHYVRAFEAFDRAQADRAAEIEFRVSKRPRPAQAWLDHLDRLIRDPASSSQEFEESIALMLEDQPTSAKAWRFAAGHSVAALDVEGLAEVIQGAAEAGIEERELLDLRLTHAATAATAIGSGDSDLVRFQEVLADFRSQEGRGGRITAEGVELLVDLWRHSFGLEGAPKEAKVVRKARRHARRHRRDPDALRTAAAALISLDHLELAAKIIERRSKRISSPERGQLLLEAARLRALSEHLRLSKDGLERSADLLEDALEHGAPPALITIEEVANAQLRSSPTVDPQSVHPLLREWFGELDRAERELGDDKADRLGRLAVALGLSQVAVLLDRGEGITQPLIIARSLDASHPLTRLVGGQYHLVVGEPAKADEIFASLEDSLSDSAERWSLARWRLLACQQTGDQDCVRAQRARLLELWDHARVPDKRDGIWAHALFVGEVSLYMVVAPGERLRVKAEINPRPVLFGHPPHDRSGLQ